MPTISIAPMVCLVLEETEAKLLNTDFPEFARLAAAKGYGISVHGSGPNVRIYLDTIAPVIYFQLEWERT